MLFRFSLYGFLKNQRYFEPFLVLAFLQKGMSFTLIGLLIAFREISINLLEVPTGAVADVLGRRRSMIASFTAYISAFAVFGLSTGIFMLFAAMFFFSVGEAFRTGTHKAIIFNWLAGQGRENEKTAVYGFTRSWSKLGSAVSVVIAGLVVFITGDFSKVFLLSIFPAGLNIINFLTYPSYLDGAMHRKPDFRVVWKILISSIRASLRIPVLRRLLVESMGYEGLFKTTKDYIQPALKSAALALPVCLYMSDRQRTAVLAGAVYFILHVLSSIASRNAGRYAKLAGGEVRGARLLWFMNLVLFAVFAGGVLAGHTAVVIMCFAGLALLQNLWRPMLVGRCASCTDDSCMATVLSIESQAKSIFTAVMAPAVGWSIDLLSVSEPSLRFLPVAGLGILTALLMLATGRKSA